MTINIIEALGNYILTEFPSSVSLYETYTLMGNKSMILLSFDCFSC
jgi:hypothetical protein